MEAAHHNRFTLSAIIVSSELVLMLLWLIGKPGTNRLVGKFFSDDFAR